MKKKSEKFELDVEHMQRIVASVSSSDRVVILVPSFRCYDTPAKEDSLNSWCQVVLKRSASFIRPNEDWISDTKVSFVVFMPISELFRLTQADQTLYKADLVVVTKEAQMMMSSLDINVSYVPRWGESSVNRELKDSYACDGITVYVNGCLAHSIARLVWEAHESETPTSRVSWNYPSTVGHCVQAIDSYIKFLERQVEQAFGADDPAVFQRTGMDVLNVYLQSQFYTIAQPDNESDDTYVSSIRSFARTLVSTVGPKYFVQFPTTYRVNRVGLDELLRFSVTNEQEIWNGIDPYQEPLMMIPAANQISSEKRPDVDTTSEDPGQRGGDMTGVFQPNKD